MQCNGGLREDAQRAFWIAFQRPLNKPDSPTPALPHPALFFKVLQRGLKYLLKYKRGAQVSCGFISDRPLVCTGQNFQR